jgi:hypothetical protein
VEGLESFFQQIDRSMARLGVKSAGGGISGFGAKRTFIATGPCACRKLNPGILVMQSAQDWATKNVPGAIDGARDRCIFLQG